jgi:L-fuconolactonase
MDVVDSHVHFWDPARLAYPWLADVPPLRRRFVPADLDTGGHRISAAVFVEAGGQDAGPAADPDAGPFADPLVSPVADPLAEVSWIEEIAAGWPPLRAIVAHAPVEHGAAVRPHLAALARHPRVVGVRRNVQDEPAGTAVADGFVDGVRALAGHGYTFDLCLRHHQLSEVTELVRRVPEVLFVLDHLGKPPVRAGRLDPWRADLSRLAALPNVVCKLSGLATEADPDRWTEADVLPYLRHALAEFGPERCLVGGDWPVATLATTYGRWLDVVATAVTGRTGPDGAGADRAGSALAAVFGGTARRVYRL